MRFAFVWAACCAVSAAPAAACEHHLDDLRARGVKVGRPLTAEQVERINMHVRSDGGKVHIAPFGDSHDKWAAFKSGLRMAPRARLAAFGRVPFRRR